MPKIIGISGEIGWDVYPEQIRAQIEEAENNEPIEFQISSPGGYIYDGLEIFNLIRNYEGETTTFAVGMAASMASYLLMAGDIKKAASNAIFMIHNARGYTGGDHVLHRRRANVLEGMSKLLGQEYVAQTGKTKEVIAQLMDDETYLFGNEILESGFVDEIVSVEQDQDAARDDMILDAMVKVDAMAEKINAKPEDFKKIAALLPDANAGGADVRNSIKRDSALKPESKQKETMDLTQLLALPENAEAKTEHDALIVAAGTESAEIVQDKDEGSTTDEAARIAKITNVLESDSYKSSHKSVAMKALKGAVSMETFDTIIAMADADIEEEKAKAAKGETDELGETSTGKTDKSNDGKIRTDEDEAAAIAELKGV